MFCREWTLVKTQLYQTEGQPLRCRSWQCEHCAPERASRLIAEVLGGRPNKFLTLTVNPDTFSGPAERAQKLVWAWRCLRLRAMRKFQMAKLPFYAVFEKTKAGEPHLHILLRTKYIPQGWISDTMRELIDAPIVDIQSIAGRRKTASYVAKYIGKDPHKFPGTKRYWKSQDYDLRPAYNRDENNPIAPVWSIVKMDLEMWIEEQFHQGNRLDDYDAEHWKFRRRQVPIDELMKVWLAGARGGAQDA